VAFACADGAGQEIKCVDGAVGRHTVAVVQSHAACGSTTLQAEDSSGRLGENVTDPGGRPARSYGGKLRAGHYHDDIPLPRQEPFGRTHRHSRQPMRRELMRRTDQPIPSLPRAVVQSVTMACCAAWRVTFPEQTAVCSFVSTGSFLLLTPPPGL
jgi:hypothetical protein